MTSRKPGTPKGEEAFVTWVGVRAEIDRRIVLNEIDLDIGGSEFVALVGPNGAGKTTLLRAMLGILPVRGGAKARFRPVAGLSSAERRAFFSYLAQERDIAWPMPVRDVVALGLGEPLGAMSRMSQADAERLADVMWHCGLERIADRPVTTLSGGERSRVLLARALVSPAPFLIADEPIAWLDPSAQLKVMELLADRARSGRPVVAAVHDVSLAARYATRLIVLHRGRKVADGDPVEVLMGGALDKAFGVKFRLYETEDGPLVDVVAPRPAPRSSTASQP